MSLSTVLSSKRKDKKNPQFFYENQSNWRLILTWRKQKLELSVFFGWSPKYELYLYPSKENPKLQKKNIFFLELDTKSFFFMEILLCYFLPMSLLGTHLFLDLAVEDNRCCFPLISRIPTKTLKNPKEKKKPLEPDSTFMNMGQWLN